MCVSLKMCELREKERGRKKDRQTERETSSLSTSHPVSPSARALSGHEFPCVSARLRWVLLVKGKSAQRLLLFYRVSSAAAAPPRLTSRRPSPLIGARATSHQWQPHKDCISTNPPTFCTYLMMKMQDVSEVFQQSYIWVMMYVCIGLVSLLEVGECNYDLYVITWNDYAVI